MATSIATAVAAALATLPRAYIRIAMNGTAFSGGKVERFDGGVAMTVAATATPTATQIGVDIKPGAATGVFGIRDGSGVFFPDANGLRRATCVINGATLGVAYSWASLGSGLFGPQVTFYTTSTGAAVDPTGLWYATVIVYNSATF